MRYIFIIFIAFFFGFSSYGQAPANATVFDCNGLSKNIYQTLASGKSIVVAHKGVDCSICRNSAAGWQTWAAVNTNKVEVWGAITYTYNASSFIPPCQKTIAWKNQYNWIDIFTFADSSRQFVANSSPRYYVYSAIDSTIVYSGNSPTTARNMALSQSTVGIKRSILKGSKIYFSNNNIILNHLSPSINKLSIFTLNGQLVKNSSLNSTSNLINVSSLDRGVYILNFTSSSNKSSSIKLAIH